MTKIPRIDILLDKSDFAQTHQSLQDSLHKKHSHYYVRQKIFGENHDSKVFNLRNRSKEKKSLQNVISSSIVDEYADDRAYASVEINGKKIMGLIDSGANITCLGSGGNEAMEFLREGDLKLTSLNTDLETADGAKRKVVGYCNVKMNFRMMLKTFNYLLLLN